MPARKMAENGEKSGKIGNRKNEIAAERAFCKIGDDDSQPKINTSAHPSLHCALSLNADKHQDCLGGARTDRGD